MVMRRRKSGQRATSAAGTEKNGATAEGREDPAEAGRGTEQEQEGMTEEPGRNDTPEPAELSVSAEVVVAELSVINDADAPSGLRDARSFAAAGELAAAIEAYRGHIVNASNAAHARLELARLYEAKGEWQLALEQYEAAREEEDSLDATLGAASALAALGRFDAADRELRRAARSHPSNAQVFATSGTIAFRRGLYTEAEQDLKRAIELDPENGYAYFYRGESLNQLSRVDEALEMLERATQILPSLGRAYYVMGILFDKKGRPQEAAAMYRKAREIAAA